MIARKLFLTFVLGLWYALLSLAFVVGRPALHRTYAAWIEPFRDGLPLLTTRVAMPMLGPEAGAAGASALFLAGWGLLWVLPTVILVLLWLARDRGSLVEVWTYGLSAYALFVLLSTLAVGFGLWLPFAPLS